MDVKTKRVRFGKAIALAVCCFAFSESGIAHVASNGDEFGYADNVYNYVNASVPSLTAPGAKDVIYGRALEECGVFITNPNYAPTEISHLRSSGDKYAQFKISAVERLNQRCKDFAFRTEHKPADSLALFNKAASQNNPEAVAHNLAWGMHISSLSAPLAESKARQVVRSGNGNAIFDLAQTLGDNGPFAGTPGNEIGSPISIYAWQLVACDRGKNCSASSPVVQLMCLSSSICGPGDFRSNLQYSTVSADEYQQIAAAEQKINTALADGTITNYFIHK